MSKKFFASMAIMAVLLTGTSFAAINNIKVSGDLATQAISRDLSFGSGRATGNIDREDFVLSQVNLRFDADLTENVTAVVSLLNERIWGNDSNAGNTDSNSAIDLGLAYVELKEFLYQPLTLIVGRQNLRYGSGLIVGDPDTNQFASSKVPSAMADLSLRKSFDAIRAILNYSPVTVDLVAAKIDSGNQAALSTNIKQDDVNLFGINVAYDWGSKNAISEAYAFLSDNRPTLNTVIADPKNKEKVYAIGGRTQLDLVEKLTASVEGAYQFGDIGTDALYAWAGIVGLEYRLDGKCSPKLGLNYFYLSGDKRTTDGHNNAWQSMFEDQTPGEILNILMPNSNAQIYKATASCKPREDLTLGVAYLQAYLSQKLYPGTIGYANTMNTYSVNRDKRFVGQEIDLTAAYDYTEDVQLKAVGGLFLPGKLLAENNRETAYSGRVSLNVQF